MPGPEHDAPSPNPTYFDWLTDDGLGERDLPTSESPVLPRLRLAPSGADPTADLALREQLGAGGMAVVTLAEQRSLQRDVAVKRCREPGDPRNVRALLREAWVTGQLDHPNVVPVHLVGETDEGEPVVVLRAIGGQPWHRRIMEDPADDPEALARHLAIFVAVCNAVHFAHERGFLHRDIKPANVQIGTYGEVYLLDWGVAEPLDQPQVGPAGTPAYLAPEMLEPGSPDRRSDVFLLGATLLHVLTGRPPRDRTSSAKMIKRLQVDTRITVPDDLPPGLAPLLRRACAPHPEDRFPTAAALRDAVLTWQVDLATASLLRGARTRLEACQQAVDRALLHPEDDAAALSARERFAAARFAFEQVLADRPDHAGAREGLGACLQAMIRLELAQGHPTSARALLAAHPAAPPELTAEVNRRADQIEAHVLEQQRLAAIARSYDTSEVARDWLMVFGATASGVVVAIVSTNLVLGSAAEQTPLRMMSLVTPPVVVFGITVFWRRHSLMAHPLGRTLVLSATGLLSGVVLARFGCVVAGIPADAAVLMEPFAISAWMYGGASYLTGLLPVATFGIVASTVNLFLHGSAWGSLFHNGLILTLVLWSGSVWWRALAQKED